MAALDLIAATEGDEESFETCVCCGSSAVTHRALYVSAVHAVPVGRTEEGGYRVAAGW